MKKLFLLLITALLLQNHTHAQGTWQTLTNGAPHENGGVTLLLTDGTVMCLTYDSSGSYPYSYAGNTWDLLTPDSNGSYLNGTWTTLSAMHDTRLYCSTWVMPDGNVYVAGGEYGTGASTGEQYNPVTQVWKHVFGLPGDWQVFDGSAESLPDGTILQGALKAYDFSNAQQDLIYNESTHSYSVASPCLGSHEEVSWTKLPDGSVMNIDPVSMQSERYIPQMKQWINDSDLKNYVMDAIAGETGPGFLLPNGKLIFLSDTTYAAIYTPSGDSTPGSWAQGPAMPVAHGVHLGCPDAPAAMMPNGKILCAFGPAGSYNYPVYFYEYDYLTNTFTEVGAPGGDDTISISAFDGTMLDLPDGTVLFSDQGDSIYYQYTPSGAPLASGKPTIDSIISDCPDFTITGKLFNGISEGAAYGDDWQMATNYPIVRLTNGTRVYYARTTNWNRPGAVMTGSLEDTASFTVPTMPEGNYNVEVVANGIASSPYNLTLSCVNLGIVQAAEARNIITVYPNPNKGVFTIELSVISNESLLEVYNMLGERVKHTTLNANSTVIDLSNNAAGIYFYRVLNNEGGLVGEGKVEVER